MRCLWFTILLFFVLPYMVYSFSIVRSSIANKCMSILAKKRSAGLSSICLDSATVESNVSGTQSSISIPGINIDSLVANSLIKHFGSVDNIYKSLHLSDAVVRPIPEQLLSQSASQASISKHVKSLITKAQYTESLGLLKKVMNTTGRSGPVKALNNLYLGASVNSRLFGQLLVQRKQEDRLYFTGRVSYSTSSIAPSDESIGNDEMCLIPCSELSNVLFMYTDGSCIGNNNAKTCPAGWGVTITKPAIDPISNGIVDGGAKTVNVDLLALEKDASHCKLVEELYGPVVLDASSPYFLGATVGSNNTAELTAIGEALLWLLNYVRSMHQKKRVSKRKLKQLKVFIRYDSEYAAKSIQGIFNGSKNVELIHKIREIYREVKGEVGSLTFLHVKGHSGHLYNDRADELANLGGTMTSGFGGRHNVAASTDSSNPQKSD